MHAVSGALFNHESPRRDETFVTRKISRAVAAGPQSCRQLGYLDAVRDWGHAADYVEGVWAMLQHPVPDGYVLATGTGHSVRDFVERAFAVVGRTIEWRGAGAEETGVDAATGREVVSIDPAYFRPAEVDALIGDASKACRVLGWVPRTSFDSLVREMVEHDVRIVARAAAQL